MNPLPFYQGPALPAVFGLAVLQITSGLGCGPHFRETILAAPAYLIRSPEFHFMDQFSKRAGAFVAETEREDRACTLDREMSEMEIVMAEALPEADLRQTWLDDYRSLRTGMLVRGDQSLWRVTKEKKKVDADLDPRVGLRQWPDQLPGELKIYLDGASHYLNHLSRKPASAASPDLDLARGQWKKLLDLPPGQRLYRGTWAAWMLFRSTPAKEIAEQRRWLGLVRQLSAEGSADCQHFADEATVILSRMETPAGDATPYERVSVTENLRALARREALGHSRGSQDLASWVSSDFVYSAKEAQEISEDESLVEMVNFALIEQTQSFRSSRVSDSMRKRLKQWFDFLEAHPPTRSAEFALLAWASYSLGDFDAARRSLALAPNDDSTALWLRGKLAAMDGRLNESRRLLGTVAAEVAAEAATSPRFDLSDPQPDQSDSSSSTPEERSRERDYHLKGDLALVQISQSRHEAALATLLDTEHWFDAAYVAERLLSPEQVLTLARRLAPPRPDVAGSSEGLSVEEIQNRHVTSFRGESDPENVEDRFRHLVARAAAREGWYKDARPFFPPAMRDALDHYAEALSRGKDRRLSSADRAEALWKAARMHRSLGMAFFGYEIGPDHAAVGGSYDLGDLGEARQLGFFADSWEEVDKMSATQIKERRYLLPVTPDERWALRHYGPGGKPRFHYRYDAAQLAWEAAALRPENDELAAKILCTAGTWLKDRDAESADRFYQALVARHPETKLGRKAETQRWFPAIETAYNDHFPALR